MVQRYTLRDASKPSCGGDPLSLAELRLSLSDLWNIAVNLSAPTMLKSQTQKNPPWRVFVNQREAD
jgi:hypothetical protein